MAEWRSCSCSYGRGVPILIMEAMKSPDMKKILGARARKVDEFLAGAIAPGAPDRLRESMLYSLKAGGKRLRPVLCMACAELGGLAADRVVPFAAAIEMIHTYSLIHDDLPAMDDDDYRRGQLANHKKFDEATAILAGDALLTDAFAIIGAMDFPAAPLLAALTELARAAGSAGMVGGQALDMQYTGAENTGLAQAARMQAMKTGAMLASSCVCGVLLAGADSALIDAIRIYGMSLGKAFQIADDILDITGDQKTLGKPVGSDERSGKNTYPSLVGLAESRRIARLEIEKAKAALPDHPEAAFLASLADYAIERSN